MSKRITLTCALIGLVAFVAAPAYAEVQNIKVSGDIQAMAVYRNNYDLDGGRFLTVADDPNFGYGDFLNDDQDSFLMSIIRLRVDADLTDNVAVCVRLANLREWDVNRNLDSARYRDGDPALVRWRAAAAAAGAPNLGTNSDDASIILDLGYITLKEMLYSPLTLVIGRQELNYGTGLIVGNGLWQDPNNSIAHDDLSTLHGYDAVRAILDYDPWTLDLILAKMEEGDDSLDLRFVDDMHGADRDSDTDLYGLNLGYLFDQYEAEMEGYFWFKRDENYWLTTYNVNGISDRVFEENKVYTAGLRGSVVPIENLTLLAEVAGQWGEIVDEDQDLNVSAGIAGGAVPGPVAGGEPNGLGVTRDRSALLANVGGRYDFADVRFTPSLGVEYLYTSGEEIGDEPLGENRDTSDFDAWDPMYRGKRMGDIRDALESMFTTADAADTSGLTNQQTVKVTGGLDLGELVDGLSLNMAYLHYWFDEAPSWANQDDEIGDEVNMVLTYDYTEDVQFGLGAAWFIPGDYYDEPHRQLTMQGGGMNTGNDQDPVQAAQNADNRRRAMNETAVSVIGSCKVTF